MHKCDSNCTLACSSTSKYIIIVTVQYLNIFISFKAQIFNNLKMKCGMAIFKIK
jgi:hypothetical protein